MSLKGMIKKTAPEILLRTMRTRRAWREHEKTRPVWQRIDQELLEETRLVSDVLEMLDRMPKGGVVAEIGVAEGKLSQEILKRTAPRKLYLVDPWDVDTFDAYSEQSFVALQSKFKKEIDSGRVELRRGYSGVVLPTFPENYFDWVYVDAAHDYDNVSKDLEMCSRIVKPRGLISGHDYVHWVDPTVRHGVVEAVNEFVNRTRSWFVMLTNQCDKVDSFAIRLNK